MRRPEGYPPTPEHDKRDGKEDQFQLIGEFLEWLGEKGIHLAVYGPEDDQLWPTHQPIEQTLADFFGVDLNAFRAESDAVLEWVREQNVRGEAL